MVCHLNVQTKAPLLLRSLLAPIRSDPSFSTFHLRAFLCWTMVCHLNVQTKALRPLCCGTHSWVPFVPSPLFLLPVFLRFATTFSSFWFTIHHRCISPEPPWKKRMAALDPAHQICIPMPLEDVLIVVTAILCKITVKLVIFPFISPQQGTLWQSG